MKEKIYDARTGIEVFNNERVKIRFTFEDVLAGYAE